MINELKKVASDPVILEMDVVTALLLIAQVQLALTHPENNLSSTVVLKKLVHDFGEKLKQKYPEIAILIDTGWNRIHDN